MTAASYDSFCIPAPSDPRLEGGGGYQVCDLFNLKPTSVGQVDNYTTMADDFGKRIEHWNGMDVTLQARLPNGLRLQGGVSTGRTSTDECDIRAALPETAVLNRFCHVDTNFLTQVKGLASYIVPKIDIQLAATLQSLAGPNILANYIATNAVVIAVARPAAVRRRRQRHCQRAGAGDVLRRPHEPGGPAHGQAVPLRARAGRR